MTQHDNSAFDNPEQVADLIVRYYDDVLSPDELALLREALMQSASARDWFVRWGLQAQVLNESLAPQYREEQAEDPSSDVLALGAAPDTEQSYAQLLQELAQLEAQVQPAVVRLDAHDRDTLSKRAARPSLLPARRDVALAAGYVFHHAVMTKAAAMTALAALILIALLVLAPWQGLLTPTANPATPSTTQLPDTIATKTPVATLTAMHDAQWAGPASAGPQTGDPLTPGQRLNLTQGFAEITTNRGAIAIIEAPATIELTNSDNALRLHTGKLVGICETPSSKGFLVRTEHTDITDLGTRFGVDATRSDATEVHVFDGEVELARPAIGTGQATRKTLYQGQAARAQASTAGFVDRPSDAERFAGIQILDQTPLGGTAAEAGVQAVSGQLQWSNHRFTGRLPNDWSSENAVVFKELSGYTLSTDVAVTIDQPGTYTRFMSQPASATIPRGTVIRSYIVFFKPGRQAGAATVQGRVSFDGEVLGIIANEPHWLAFTAALPDRTFYPNLEENILINGGVDADRLVLDADGRTLSVRFAVTTGTADTIRVIVREPATVNPDPTN